MPSPPPIHPAGKEIYRVTRPYIYAYVTPRSVGRRLAFVQLARYTGYGHR